MGHINRYIRRADGELIDNPRWLTDRLTWACINRGREMIESPTSEVQVSYDLAREDKDLTVATIIRVFENGFKVLALLEGEDAEAFIDAWNSRMRDVY